jgi:maltooligosyltrehalose trehalohydrolase
MAKLQIWAPHIRKMEIALHGQRLPLRASGDGWMHFEDDRLKHDVDYELWLDGEGPFPDPRSAFQPEGFEGPSRYVDHAQFVWSDAAWRPGLWRKALIYELHIGTFTPTGTFVAAIEKLEYLVELGVTHVELMPVVEFPGSRGWGYDGVNLYAPHHGYGGPDGLKRLIDACHMHGLSVILDVVYNHLGPLGNHLQRFGPYFTDSHHTPWGMAVNVDGRGSDEVRRFFIDNALMWLRDYHVDALRLDATDTIIDNSALPFLEQLAADVKLLEEDIGRPFTLIAESSLNDPRLVRPVEQHGMGLGAIWNEDHHHALHTLLTPERGGYYADYGNLADLWQVLGSGFCYDNRYSRYRGRHYGRPGSDLRGTQLVAFTQNHDQVGNRPGGERLGHLVDPARLKLAAAVTLLAPFVPLLFQGEEWNASTPFLYFTDFPDAGLGVAVFEGRRKQAATLGLNDTKLADPQSAATWQRSQLNWAEQEDAKHREVLAWYRTLIRLRREHSELAAGPLDPRCISCDEQARWLRFCRGSKRVLCNFADVPQAVPIGSDAGYRVLLISAVTDVFAPRGKFMLPPFGIAVLAMNGDHAGTPT